MARQDKHAKLRVPPKDEKKPRIAKGGFPSRQEYETVAWRFGIADLDGRWGWRTAAGRDWWEEILPKLQAFEKMTWQEIMRASGGRRRGSNSHSVKVEKLSREAKHRLAELNQDDVSELFSLRLDSTKRIYGIRDGRVLKLLWYDPYHGENARAVYPVRKK